MLRLSLRRLRVKKREVLRGGAAGGAENKGCCQRRPLKMLLVNQLTLSAPRFRWEVVRRTDRWGTATGLSDMEGVPAPPRSPPSPHKSPRLIPAFVVKCVRGGALGSCLCAGGSQRLVRSLRLPASLSVSGEPPHHPPVYIFLLRLTWQGLAGISLVLPRLKRAGKNACSIQIEIGFANLTP